MFTIRKSTIHLDISDASSIPSYYMWKGFGRLERQDQTHRKLQGGSSHRSCIAPIPAGVYRD